MPKFSIDRFPAGFFDISQDVVRTLPIEVIEKWTRSNHSLDTALAILKPYAVQGTTVSTDSAGLTKLSRDRSLMEILCLINRPKELVHAFGKAIGGQSIGVWAADNTEMFYPSAIPTADVLSMLLATMDRIRSECEVHIGAAVHSAEFFHLSGGLYGTEADRVEQLAEDYTEGGEIIATQEVFDRLGRKIDLKSVKRTDLPAELGDAYRINDGPRLAGLDPRDFQYPFPYADDFYEDLRQYVAGTEDKLHLRYTQRRSVVLIEREREESDIPEIAVLNDLALSAAMSRIGSQLLKTFDGVEIKTAGSIGIFTFTEAAAALDFAREFRNAFLIQGIACRIGIDAGEVLVFNLDSGGLDIAGMPVNVASKLAQDRGEFGKIYLSKQAASTLALEPEFVPIEVKVSGVILDAFIV